MFTNLISTFLQSTIIYITSSKKPRTTLTRHLQASHSTNYPTSSLPSFHPSIHPPRPNTLPYPTHPPIQPLITHYLILSIHPTNPLPPITPSYPSSHPTHPPHQPLTVHHHILPIILSYSSTPPTPSRP
ncbi:hypothetical protein Pcinc_033860 [Petrolisthes cinctipes]|uniref:Uncharacterized protein n=1 Tax=Petrolisthes cinctipes TaxID=88211 RepID=A0AAE1ERE4_PETCI|nr:hypothetical protein Pcinc_033860 [Petrolisthes cinctipes]